MKASNSSSHYKKPLTDKNKWQICLSQTNTHTTQSKITKLRKRESEFMDPTGGP